MNKLDKYNYDEYLVYSLAGAIENMKTSICKEGYQLPPYLMKVIKEMRNNLNDIIVEDMN